MLPSLTRVPCLLFARSILASNRSPYFIPVTNNESDPFISLVLVVAVAVRILPHPSFRGA
jgi:hypothetical protein